MAATESQSRKAHREAAQLTKATKMVRALRTALYPEYDDAAIELILDYCDDAEWDKIREAAGVNPTGDKSTSCTVSRTVKTMVRNELKKNRRIRFAKPGYSVFDDDN